MPRQSSRTGIFHLHPLHQTEKEITTKSITIEFAVSKEWRSRYDASLAAAGFGLSFHRDGEALAAALTGSWAPVDLVVLDLALATPALRSRLGPDGPRLLAFGEPDYAAVALAANLADFLPAAPSEAALHAAIEAAVEPAAHLADISSHSLGRLRGMTPEAARIADALARIEAAAAADVPAIDPAKLRSAIRARRARDRFFPADLFGEPAWDMLLDLALAAAERRAVAVSSLCIAAAVPTTTALRWIRNLCDAGLFERRDDPSDARRAFISLSPATEQAMARYLGQTAQPWL